MQTQIETAFGVGLEAPEDYLVGLQFKSKTLIGGSLSAEAAGAERVSSLTAGVRDG